MEFLKKKLYNWLAAATGYVPWKCRVFFDPKSLWTPPSPSPLLFFFPLCCCLGFWVYFFFLFVHLCVLTVCGVARKTEEMALLRVTATAELFLEDEGGIVREQLQAAEFFVCNAKRTMSWPPPALSKYEALLLHGGEWLEKEEGDEVTLGERDGGGARAGPVSSLLCPIGWAAFQGV
ncbi:hypothetical protein TCDM_08394 [Trypanosoma cruzi Dm28c]|uniref:Uncharacterized protein n=1 Tax=Trypanosoma cruzi Dm28c TaxID=1416333 RepID=V5BCD7_TRYCR|nr:hypothetical protein TCDM_08394 [Trypanosoma cruzi Dm28c]